MGFDPFSPLSAAYINVLCLPAARITPDRFSKFLSVVTKFSCIQSERPDLAHGRDEASLSPSKDVFLFNFGSNWSSGQVQGSFFFEPNREPEAIMGFVDGSELLPRSTAEVDLNEMMAKTLDGFRQRILQDYGFSAVVRIIVFDATSTNDLTDVLYIPAKEDEMRPGIVSRFFAQLSLDVRLSLEERSRSEANGAQSNGDVQTELSGHTNHTTLAQRPSESQSRSASQDPSIRPNDAASYDRPSKLIAAGLVHLQTGQWTRAVEPLAEGAVIARDLQDHAWHGRALEALLTSMLLHFWMGLEFSIPQCCQNPSRIVGGSSSTLALVEANKSISDILGINKSKNPYQIFTNLLPGLIAAILDLYERAEVGARDRRPILIACQSRIRWANFLVILKKHGSTLTRSALADLVGIEADVRPSATTNDTTLVLRGSTLTNMLLESATKAQSQLLLQDAIPVLVAVGHGLSNLHMDRKQAFHLKALLQDLAPRLSEAQRVGAAEAGVHPAAGDLATQPALDRKKQDIITAFRILLDLTLRSYDLPGFPQTNVKDGNLSEISSLIAKRLADWTAVHSSGDIAVKVETLRLCLRVSDAVPDAESSLYLMCVMLDFSRQTITMPPATPGLLPLVSVDEQNRLMNGIRATVASATKSERHTILAEYWDDFLVRDIQITEEPNSGKLMPHSPQDLSITTSTGSEVKKDPFIYNPFSQSKGTPGASILVRNESVNFSVVLQNPLEIEIEIDDISLIADGCDFESSHHSIVLGPFCSQVFTLAGTPRLAGSLKINGCRATVHSCRPRDFAIFRDDWQHSNHLKRKVVPIKAKVLHRALSNSSEIKIPEAAELNLNVVEPLPLLQISSCSLVQRSIMLLEGQSELFDITLRNNSDLDVDFLLFTYEDSVTMQLREALNNKDLLPHDLYELQYQLATNPAIRRWNQKAGRVDTKQAVYIGSQSEASFTFQILGKPGLVTATILIDYGFLGRPRAELEGPFYTRQLHFTINTTVNGSIDVSRCSIMPLQEASSLSKLFSAPRSMNADQEISLKSDEASWRAKDYCMLQLDLRNVWPQPLDASIQVDLRHDEVGPSVWENCYSNVLQPGQVERAILMIPRLYIADAMAPIPNIDSKRQFVVTASRMSKELEAASRESFWYREKLLDRLKMTWKDDKGHRSGAIDLRKGIRLSARMLEALRIEHVHLSFQVEAALPEEKARVTQLGFSHFEIQRNVFAKLLVKVRNRTTEDLRLLLRLQPSLRNQPYTIALDLSKRFAWSGVLQRVLRSSVKPNEEQTTDLGIVALAVGKYEINATVEELCIPSSRNIVVAVEGQPTVERRIWHARHPCLIDAVESLPQIRETS